MKKVFGYLLLITSPLYSTERSPIPDNGKFSIGRETITSTGYGSYVTGMPCFIGNHSSLIFYFNSLSYGISDRVGCTFTVPVILHNRENDAISHGLFDLRFIMQWHLYRNPDNIVVLKTGMWFPTGDISANPPLSFGSFNPTVYLMALHSSDHLFANALVGAVIATTRKHRNTGGFIDYQFSLGPKFSLHTKNNGKIYTFLELQGYHFFESKLRNVIIPNTGEDLILLGPSISYDSDFFQILGNISVALIDHRKGIQPRTDYYASLWYGRRF